MSRLGREEWTCPDCGAAALDPQACFCSRCGLQLGEEHLVCASCGAKSSTEARFCHACGKALPGAATTIVTRPKVAFQPVSGSRPAEAPAVVAVSVASPAGPSGADAGGVAELDPVAGLPPPGKGLTIEFYGRASSRAAETLALARSHPSFTEGQGPEGTLYRVTFQLSEIPLLIRLHDLMESWVGRRAMLDGRKVEWLEFFTFLRCYKGRLASIDPESYCFWDESNNLNLWGCFRSGVFFSDGFAGNEWLAFGRFESDNSFVFDKKRVIELLDRSLAPYRLCPALDLKFVNAMLRVFPERVNPNLNRDWTFLEASFGEKGHSSSIFRKDQTGEKKIEVLLRGVRPASAEAAARIFAEMKKRALNLLQRPPA